MKVASLISLLSKVGQSMEVRMASNPDWPMEHEIAGISIDDDKIFVVQGPVIGYGSKETWKSMVQASKEYPYTDHYGAKFRVERISTHEWNVFAEQSDIFGTYETHVDSVDDCDTEDEAVMAFQERMKEDGSC